MPTFNLDSPNFYVGCPSFGNPNDLVYIRDFTNEPSATDIVQLDPRSDNDILVVHGTEIKGDLLRKLGKCTQLQRRSGSIRVNCNGACYFGAGGPWHRTVDNVIFDWSIFGVTVPNTSNESLKSQINQKEKMIEELKREILELNAKLAQKESQVVKDDRYDSKISCMESKVESIKEEVELMNKTLLERSKEMKEKDLEVQEMSKKVSKLDLELNLTKGKLEQSISISSLMQEAMNCAKNENNWYRQEITALRMEISQHGRVSRR